MQCIQAYLYCMKGLIFYDLPQDNASKQSQLVIFHFLRQTRSTRALYILCWECRLRSCVFSTDALCAMCI